MFLPPPASVPQDGSGRHRWKLGEERTPRAPTTCNCRVRSRGCSAEADAQGNGWAASLLGREAKGSSQSQADLHHSRSLDLPKTTVMNPNSWPNPALPCRLCIFLHLPLYSFASYSSSPSLLTAHAFGNRQHPALACPPPPPSHEQPRGATSQGRQRHRRFSPGRQGVIAPHLESSLLPRI